MPTGLIVGSATLTAAIASLIIIPPETPGVAADHGCTSSHATTTTRVHRSLPVGRYLARHPLRCPEFVFTTNVVCIDYGVNKTNRGRPLVAMCKTNPDPTASYVPPRSGSHLRWPPSITETFSR